MSTISNAPKNCSFITSDLCSSQTNDCFSTSSNDVRQLRKFDAGDVVHCDANERLHSTFYFNYYRRLITKIITLRGKHVTWGVNQNYLTTRQAKHCGVWLGLRWNTIDAIQFFIWRTCLCRMHFPCSRFIYDCDYKFLINHISLRCSRILVWPGGLNYPSVSQDLRHLEMKFQRLTRVFGARELKDAFGKQIGSQKFKIAAAKTGCTCISASIQDSEEILTAISMFLQPTTRSKNNYTIYVYNCMW
jgi:hypothetical protein